MGEKEVIRFTTNLFLQETQKVARNYFLVLNHSKF
jgi:hypothetical protein